jgi:hypothetical protein
MSFIKKAFIALTIIVIAFIGIGFMLPSEWRMERSIVINATPDRIYPYVANFQTGWPQWSAWDIEYSDSVYTSSGAQEGVGAIRSWTSAKMGNGFQEIVKANPQEGITFELTMTSYGTKMLGTITFTPVEGGTLVHWSDVGQMGNNPVMRWMGLFMDRMMGKMLEDSLANLKQVAESQQDNA